MRGQLGLAVAASIVVMLLMASPATGAATVRFLDTRGGILDVEPSTGRFTFSAPAGSVSGFSKQIKPGARASFSARNADVMVIGTVDLVRLRANATLVHATSHRWLATMRDATITIETSPTSTPTPAADAFRVVGEAALANDPGRTFQIDAFQNPGVSVRGRFVYRDPLGKFLFTAVDVTSLRIVGRAATVEGIGSVPGRGLTRFELELRDDDTLHTSVFSLKVRGFNYFANDTFNGSRLKFSSWTSDRPTATPTPPPTRLPTYTPTRTATTLPTTTPLPTWTPTRVLV